MARKTLANSTLNRLRSALEEERDRLIAILAEFERERREVRLAETSAEHNADPENADGGSLTFQLEMEFSKEGNARDLLRKVDKALERLDDGTYGTCEVSGKPIPLARLEALPYANTLVEWADTV